MKHLQAWERRARYVMGAAAFLAGAAALAFKAGWLATSPTYDESAWYAVSRHGGMIVTTVYPDLAGCKAVEQPPTVVCRAGKALRSEHAQAFSS